MISAGGGEKLEISCLLKYFLLSEPKMEVDKDADAAKVPGPMIYICGECHG